MGFSVQLCLSTELRKRTITNLDLGEIILLAIFLISNWPRPHNRYENRKQDSLELKIRSNTTNQIENSKTRVITEVTLLTLDGGVSLSKKPPKKG